MIKTLKWKKESLYEKILENSPLNWVQKKEQSYWLTEEALFEACMWNEILFSSSRYVQRDGKRKQRTRASAHNFFACLNLGLLFFHASEVSGEYGKFQMVRLSILLRQYLPSDAKCYPQNFRVAIDVWTTPRWGVEFRIYDIHGICSKTTRNCTVLLILRVGSGSYRFGRSILHHLQSTKMDNKMLELWKFDIRGTCWKS